MRIKLATPFIGEFPRYANVKLPDNGAVTAQNMRFDSGVLKPLNGYTLFAAAPVNSRSSVTVQRQSNGVHPGTSGYQQIGDALWAFLKCNV